MIVPFFAASIVRPCVFVCFCTVKSKQQDEILFFDAHANGKAHNTHTHTLGTDTMKNPRFASFTVRLLCAY